MEVTSLKLTNVTKVFPRKGRSAEWRAVEDATFSTRPGEFVCILGPSGCGKSTLLNILSGLDEQFDGEASIFGKPVSEQLESGIRVAYVFQEPRLMPWRTVRSNIEFALKTARFVRSEWAGRIDRVLSLVELSKFAEFYPLQLSGGMQQRAAIARAFAIEPEVLLMDEPFSALDELTARRMRQELLSLWEADRRTVLFVTHNSLEAVYLSDRILIMKRGPGSHVCEEIVLDHLARPRVYEDPAQFETQKSVLQRRMHHVV